MKNKRKRSNFEKVSTHSVVKNIYLIFVDEVLCFCWLPSQKIWKIKNFHANKFTFIRFQNVKYEDIYKKQHQDRNGGIKCQIYPHKGKAGYSK